MSEPHHDDDEPATRRVPIEDVSEDAPTRIVPARQILDELSTVDDEPTNVVGAPGKAEAGDAPPGRRWNDFLQRLHNQPIEQL